MYASADQIKDRFPQFATQWGTGNLPDDADIEAAVDRAAQLIDDYARGWYAVPFSPGTPQTITNTCIDLVVCELRKRLYTLSPTPDQQAQAEYNALIKRLENMGMGRPPVIDWPLLATGVSPAGSPAATEAPEDRKFTIDQTF